MADNQNSIAVGIKLPPPVEVDSEVEFTGVNQQDDETVELLLMLDIESLDVGPRSVVTQIALYGLDTETDELLDTHIFSYLPIQPQLDLIHPRTISASTLWWWMQQADEAHAAFEHSTSEDFSELGILMNHFVNQFNFMTRGRSYQVWARGPQFDAVNVESLLVDCGLKAPWKYNSVRDLRTLMDEAGIHSADVPEPNGFVAHHAAWDARYQLVCLREAQRRLRRRK